MPFITKAEPKKETKTASIQLDLETRNDLDLYVEFVDKPQGVVVREILQKVFEMDEDFAEYKSALPAKQKRNKRPKVETIPEAQSA